MPPFRTIGVVHLPALPGSARGGSSADFRSIIDLAVSDAKAYETAGFDGVIVENFGDVPFRTNRVHPHTLAAMTVVAAAVRDTTKLELGINVLRNDVLAAVSIAAMTGAAFVRANVYVGAAVTDQGLIEGEAEAVQTLIRRLGAVVDVWADIDVKHAAQLAPRSAGELARDALFRGLAGAVIVTGSATGVSASSDDLAEVRNAIGNHTMYVGSGVSPDRLATLRQVADGAIVGTFAKVDGVVTNRVDARRARSLVEAAHR